MQRAGTGPQQAYYIPGTENLGEFYPNQFATPQEEHNNTANFGIPAI